MGDVTAWGQLNGIHELWSIGGGLANRAKLLGKGYTVIELGLVFDVVEFHRI